MRKLLIFALTAVTAITAVPTPDGADSSADGLDCLNYESAMLSCLAVKTVNVLGRAARSGDIEIVDGVKFTRDVPMERSGKTLETEMELMNELPRDAADRTLKLTSMLYESAMSFLKSHSLKVGVPQGSSISRALVEGRAKIKKLILPLIAAAGVKIFALAPIALGALALLTLKALFVGKIALLLAVILAFQKLFGSGSGGSSVSNLFSKTAQPVASWVEGSPTQSWSAGPTASQSQGYYRSFDVGNAAHNLAYAAQAPSNANETD